MATMLFAACGENTKIDIKYDHPERYSVGDATLSQPISGISVDWVCGNVDIRYTDDTAVRIYEEIQEGFLPLNDSLRMFYLVDEDGELEIRFCGPYKYRYGDMKKQLAADICSLLAPIRERILEFRSNDEYLERLAREGAERARESAAKTIREVREIIGFHG